MAYNPQLYMPGGYQQSTAWPTAPQPPANGIKSVSGPDGARAYSQRMPPNSSDVVFDEGEDVMYLLRTDSAGFPTMRVFDFTERRQEPRSASASPSVTRDEFDALLARIDGLEMSIGNGGDGDGEQPVPAAE